MCLWSCTSDRGVPSAAQSVSSGTDRYSSRHISQNSWSKAEVKDKHLTFRVNAKDTMLEARPTGLRTDNQLSTM